MFPGPVDDLGVEVRLIVTEECDPGMEVGGFLVSYDLIQTADQLPERVAQAAGEDDHGGPVGRFANVAVRLAALRSGGDQGGVWSGLLTRLQSRPTGLGGQRSHHTGQKSTKGRNKITSRI